MFGLVFLFAHQLREDPTKLIKKPSSRGKLCRRHRFGGQMIAHLNLFRGQMIDHRKQFGGEMIALMTGTFFR